jgi:Concanavalin A-like lectin/glucanases superfamily/Chaperone of endosialidase
MSLSIKNSQLALDGIHVTYSDNSTQNITFDNKKLTLDKGLVVNSGGVNVTGDIVSTGAISANTFNVTGPTNFSGTSNLNNLDVSGTTILHSTLSVNGSTTTGTLAVNGATNMSGTLAVNGGTWVNQLNAMQDAHMNSTLGVSGATTLSGTLAVTGASNLNNTLAVSGATLIDNTLAVTAATTLGNALTVAGATTLNNGVTVNGTSTNNGALAVSGAATVGGSLTTTGAANLNSTLNVTGASRLSNTLQVGGVTTLGNNLGVNGYANITKSTAGVAGNLLTVNNPSTGSMFIDLNSNSGAGRAFIGMDSSNGQGLLGSGEAYGFDIGTASNTSVNFFTNNSGAPRMKITAGGNLEVAGAASLANNLAVAGTTTVTGATSLNNTLGVTGATSLNNTLAVSGASSLNNTLAVTGATSLNNTLAVTGATSLNNTLAVTGVTTLGNTLDVTGAANFQNNVTVNGNLTVLGSQTAIDTTSLQIKDAAILLADGNAGDDISIGFDAQYKPTGQSAPLYAGIKRRPQTGEFVFFKDSATKIDSQSGQVASLYSFSSFTFTNNGATGRSGPTALTYNTSTNPWINGYLTLSSGIQRWKVPSTGTYYLTAAGAAGGMSQNNNIGGSGIIVNNAVSLTMNDTIYILVGQKGTDGSINNGEAGGGGGGTYIVKYLGGPTTAASSYQILLIAGGGSGGANDGAGQPGLATTTGGIDTSSWNTPATGGSGGHGGDVSRGISGGSGGGGFLEDGVLKIMHIGNGGAGASFLNGGVGGVGNNDTNDNPGGFGGGAGSGSNGNWGAGGGGGYSGGSGGGGSSPVWVWTNTPGGGGGSYDVNGVNNNATASGYNTGHGYVVISNSPPTPYIYLPFNNSVNDVQGNSTVTSTGPISYVPGPIGGYALNLTNAPAGTAGDYVRGTWVGSPNFTFSLWFNYQSYTPHDLQEILSAYNGALVLLITDSNQLDWAIPTNGSVTDAVITPYTLAINTWYHVICTFQTNGPCSMYLNGQLIGSYTNVGGLGSNNTTRFSLGGLDNANWPGYAFNGFIDEFRIYNSVVPISFASNHLIPTPYIEIPFENSLADSQAHSTITTHGTAAYVRGPGNDVTSGILVRDPLASNVVDTVTSSTLVTSGSVTYVTGPYAGSNAVSLVNTAGAISGAVNHLTESISLYPSNVTFTVSFWMNAQSIPTGSNLSNVCSFGDGVVSNIQVVINSSSELIVQGYSVSNNAFTFGSMIIAANTWYHVSIIYSGNSTCSMYVNGTLRGSTITGTGVLHNSITMYRLGSLAHASFHPYNGYMSDFRIFNRALSTAEIVKLYNYMPIGYAANFANTAGGTASNYLSGTCSLGQEFTAVLSVNLQTMPGYGQQTNIFTLGAGTQPLYQIAYLTLDSYTGLYVQYYNSSNILSSVVHIPTLPINSWNQFTTIFQASGTCSFYLNNSLVASVTANGLAGTPTHYTIGANMTGLNAMDGYVDDFRLYNLVMSPSLIVSPPSSTASSSSTSSSADIYAVVVADAFNSTSDERLKNNIVPVQGALDKIDSLRVVYHGWNNPAQAGERQIGVIAQEVQAVYPELVMEGSDGYLSVNYPKLTTVLLQSIKELKALVLSK